MFKNKKIKALLWIIGLLLIIFQVFVIYVAAPKGYYLIYDWIFYAVNYAIAFILCLILVGKRYFKWPAIIASLILITVNTTFFYNTGDVNIVISKPGNKEHELILKEYKKMSYETMKLERKWAIFGKKTSVLMGSSEYKTIENGTYKITWISGDIAVLTYKTDVGSLQESIFSFRATNTVSYVYVAPSLSGKWLEKDNPNNYFLYDRGKIVYAQNGKLYYYQDQDIEQQGITSIIIKGDETKPSIIVVLNSDSIIGSNGLINDGGTITISPISLKETKDDVYYRK
jgi:hypothetical protein